MTPTPERDSWYPGGERDALLWVREYLRIFPAGCNEVRKCRVCGRYLRRTPKGWRHLDFKP